MKNTLRTTVLALGALTLATVASAQQPDTMGELFSQTPPGMAPGPIAGTYPLSDFDSVNLFSGNLSIHLPMLKVGGRGEAGYTMTLAINSKRWMVNKECHDSNGGTNWEINCEDREQLHMPNFLEDMADMGDEDIREDYSPGRLRWSFPVQNPVS